MFVLTVHGHIHTRTCLLIDLYRFDYYLFL